MKILIYFFVTLFSFSIAFTQVENVQLANPVYSFLDHCIITGSLPHFSNSMYPLQRQEIVKALKQIRKNSSNFNENELSTLQKFEKEFEIVSVQNAVLFYSKSDSIQVLSSHFFSNDEKYIYHYKDSANSVSVLPLGSFEQILNHDITNKMSHTALLGNMGIRVRGTLSNSIGYYIQATNGMLLSGERAVALNDPKLQQNIKFTKLNSDFDFTESHINFNLDWFSLNFGRETRNIGSGIFEKFIISDNAPPMDAITLSAKFESFEYSYSHYGLIGYPDTSKLPVGFMSIIPTKFMAFHRFAIKPSWGEISFYEQVIYSNRGYELAYLNPLSFFKSLEHALHDRDNSIMGIDFTIRPISNFQLKGTFVLDDIIFSQIGKKFWSNKTAFNISAETYLNPVSIGIEYARVEPYTFSHFNKQNNYTNDGRVFGGYLDPNSQEISGYLKWYWGSRYPTIFRFIIQNHGDNIYDANGNFIRNVGGSVEYTRLSNDSSSVNLLDGDFKFRQIYEISSGFEIMRGFNLTGLLQLVRVNNSDYLNFRIKFSYEDF